MSGQAVQRASGRTAAEEAAHEAVAEIEVPPSPKLHTERVVKFDLHGFNRIRTDWRKDDRDRLKRAERTTEDVLIDRFWTLYAIRQGIFEQVREPVVDEDGVIQTDRHGLTRFRKDPTTGLYIEAWDEIGDKALRGFLLRIISHLFEWEQTAEHLRTQALYAKSVYEELFAAKFDEQPPMAGVKPTDASRDQYARRVCAEDRLFALYMSGLSREADKLVQGMDRMQQRFKDLLPSR